jgi:hypothetical protein
MRSCKATASRRYPTVVIKRSRWSMVAELGGAAHSETWERDRPVEAEREAAAARVVRSHASWSDRAIAHAVGLSATTVAAIRQRSTVSAALVCEAGD